MVRSVVLHKVQDYERWRRVYNDLGVMQSEGGVRAEGVLRSCDDPNDVLVMHDFDDEAAAKAFFASPELHAAMADAGVDGEPRVIWFGTTD